LDAQKYRYIAQRFKPRVGSEQDLLLFAAPAGDIQQWAGVPRKAFDYEHGFQRTLQGPRVVEIADFFKQSERNFSPTSIVIGLRRATITPMQDSHPQGVGVQMVSVDIEAPDLSSFSLEQLANEAVAVVESRLEPETISQIQADVEKAATAALRLQDEDVVDAEVEETLGSDSAEVLSGDRSYLADFYAALLGYIKGVAEWPNDKELRDVLYSFLKPAIIVDGQHRVFGAATVEQNMMLAVCAIPESTWAEDVYQFVVINQKAKPIKPAFLSSIIATSLSADEIESVYDRLRSSDIDIEGAEIMNRINTDPVSPFKGMIDFQVKGDPGFLQFPGMSRLAKDFKAIPQKVAVLLPNGTWKTEEEWLTYFFAFWRGVRDYFESADPRLWQKPSQDNPNNLLKIVSLQEIQQLMLDNWADSRSFRFTRAAKVESKAREFWADFPSTFFTDEWKQKGLQTTVGRGILRDAMTETRRNIGRKNWGHRRLGLFS
jgi:hypothetical protein